MRLHACFFIILSLWLQSSSAAPFVLETDRYYVEMEGDTAKLFGRHPSGAVFRDEYLVVSLFKFEELSVDTLSVNPSIVTASYLTVPPIASVDTIYQPNVTIGSPPVNATLLTQRILINSVGSVDAEFSSYSGNTTLNLGAMNVSVIPNSIKMGLQSSNWTFQSSSVAWRFWLNFSIITENPLQITRYESYDYERQATRFYVATNKLEVTILFQPAAVVDGVRRTQRFTNYTIGLLNNPTGIYFAQAWQYRRFQSMNYDPDFSLLVLAPEPQPKRGPSNGPIQPEPPIDVATAVIQADVPVWIPIVVTLAVVTVVAAAITAGVLWTRHRTAIATKRIRSMNTSEAFASSPVSTRASPAAQPDSPTARNTNGWQKAQAGSTVLRNSK